ncbi:hypothetical protein [Olivibacter jilunii]|uniref:hypothetical protein n=1 Tax=Olivibacter jilunii TaxID=985016 RepID=UPI00103079D8|nr:hypothetical protein [Olivibacter jilunii]
MESNSNIYQSSSSPTITNMIKRSVIFGDYPIREIYLSKHIKRLSEIPQLLPINSFQNTRSRYVHVKNMIDILKVLSKLDNNKNIYRECFWNDVAKGIFTHDIGHPPYGHAGERAIAKYLMNYRKFSNSIQSERLLFHRYSSIGQITNERNLFDTLPVKPFITFSDSKLDYSVSVFVDFIDDLENAVGDLQDLWIAFGDDRVRKLFNNHFRESEIEDKVSKICIEYLVYKCPALNMSHLYNSIVSDLSDIHTELKYLKSHIRLFSDRYECIAHYDMVGEEVISRILNYTENMLKKTEYVSCEENIKVITTDIVVSMSLAEVEKNIKYNC